MDLTSIQNPAPKKAAAKTSASLPGKGSAKTTSPEGHVNKANGKKAAAPVPKGPGRDPGAMLSRMKQRLLVEATRLDNTQLRALQHGDKSSAKKVGVLATDLRKVIGKFD